MSTLVVIDYESEVRAEEVRLALLKMQKEYLIDLEDAVVVVRNEQGKVKLRQLYSLTAAGAVSGALRDVGIDDGFMKSLGETLKPGTAALCVLIRQMTPDKVVEEIQKFGGKLIKTNLCNENEAKLREALSSVQRSPAPQAAAVGRG